MAARAVAAWHRMVLVTLALASVGCVLAACGAPKPAPATPAVAPPITADPPSGRARATMIMVHGGGWLGHDANAEQRLMQIPGKLLLSRGWRVVSIDYDVGADGLRDVLDAVKVEIARRSSSGPVCVYGESSGAHLALVAAARMPRIACVIGLGTPTDLPLYEATGAHGNRDQRIVAYQMRHYFGTTEAQLRPWNPVSLAPSIHADVLLLREGDDHVVPAAQDARFAAAKPGTRVLTLQAGDPAVPADHFVHGTISAHGLAEYDGAIASFVDREAARR